MVISNRFAGAAGGSSPGNELAPEVLPKRREGGGEGLACGYWSAWSQSQFRATVISGEKSSIVPSLSSTSPRPKGVLHAGSRRHGGRTNVSTR